MLTYKKGSRVERELLKYFEEHGFVAIRTAGSGVAGAPDLLVFKKGKQFALEVKAHQSEKLYIKKEQMDILKKWETVTGMQCYVVWKKNNREFLFLPIHSLRQSGESFSLGFEDALNYSLKREDLVYGM